VFTGHSAHRRAERRTIGSDDRGCTLSLRVLATPVAMRAAARGARNPASHAMQMQKSGFPVTSDRKANAAFAIGEFFGCRICRIMASLQPARAGQALFI
jgi:hypothetical protein